MRNRNDKHMLAIAVSALLLGGVAFAQTPELTQPNNSAGTVLDTPPALQTPPPDVARAMGSGRVSGRPVPGRPGPVGRGATTGPGSTGGAEIRGVGEHRHDH